MTVSSKDNRLIKEWRSLCREAKERRNRGLFAIEGARLCGDALTSGIKPQTLLYTSEARQSYPVVERLIAAAAEVAEITPELARYMSDTQTPQGVFCTLQALDNRLSFDKIIPTGRYAVLEDIRDPGNLGTVIRTAEAFGLEGIILSAGCCDIYNPKVLRGSMGGVFRLPLLITEDLPGTLETLQERGMCAYACVVDTDARPVHTVGLGSGALCVIGNEGNGLTDEAVAACAHRVTIQMTGRAESLNASMAAGIVMWEMTRPR